jgi:hypothetical protein
MSRTILPPWSVFRKTLGVEQAEPAETFDWILDESWRNELQLAKKGVDSIEGARAFLKDYRHPLEDGEMDPIRFRIGCAFGPHHSGASVSMLMNTYTYLLNNWDEFVLKTKDREQREASNYDKRQIHYSDQDEFLEALKEAKEDPESREKAVKFADLCFNFRQRFHVTYDNDTLTQMIRLIKKEESEEGLKQIAEMNESNIAEEVEMLTFLYRCPIRWFSYEGGIPPFRVTVTAEHITKMAAIYPDYAEHYDQVQRAMGDWSQMCEVAEKKPTAVFFHLFKAPMMIATQIYKMGLIYPDYRQHIEAITKTRETQLHEMVLGKMFASPAELAQQRASDAARRARFSQPLSSLFSKA